MVIYTVYLWDLYALLKYINILIGVRCIDFVENECIWGAWTPSSGCLPKYREVYNDTSYRIERRYERQRSGKRGEVLLPCKEENERKVMCDPLDTPMFKRQGMLYLN